MVPTNDPNIFIEEQRKGYVRYWRDLDNLRWEVIGTCDRRGDCCTGAVIDMPDGDVVTVESVHHLQQALSHGGTFRRMVEEVRRVEEEMDTPVTPSFFEELACCASDGTLTCNVLPSGPYQPGEVIRSSTTFPDHVAD